MTKDEALDLALEALEYFTDTSVSSMDHAMAEDAITAIKQARALDKKAESARELGLDYEPVGWWDAKIGFFEEKHFDQLQPLYTTPPAQPAVPLTDEHQAFIDSLPKEGHDKMFMQIDHWARESYKRHQSSVRGQMITAADSYESHVIWATLRWAKENTPPAQPAPVQGCDFCKHPLYAGTKCKNCGAAPVQEPVAYQVIAGALFDFMGWLTSRNERLVLSSADNASPAVEAITEFAKMRGLSLDDARVQDWQDTTPPAAQRQWVGLTNEEIDLFINGRGDEDDDDDYVEPTGDGYGLTDADLVKLVLRAEAKLRSQNT
jgi:hypothetical protein